MDSWLLLMMAEKLARKGRIMLRFYLKLETVNRIVMLEMKLVVHGRVQGVGYRYSIIEHIESNQTQVKGYVYNMPNGSVEIVAQGDIEALKDVRRFASQGSDKCMVREIEEVIQNIDEYSYDSFEIKF